ncbi:hypothetical protein BFG52_15455 [Acinetobacter larvae]|uniref:Uncharacterized protein n=1 Tax=Acinetobacter larvae TaxID=1789224 RepID=A0A1B2M4E0_9GAMM|nr:hypothetical protein BFG52_15455 [Acinetobacter larvae]
MQSLSAIVLIALCSTAYADEEQFRGMGTANAAIQDFKQLTTEGYLSNKAQVQRVDYNDIYKLQKPLQILGQDVVYLSVEYMDQYVGCCVNEGWGALLKKSAPLDAIQSYAKQHECSLKPFDAKQLDYYSLKINTSAKDEYYELSCRERDILYH